MATSTRYTLPERSSWVDPPSYTSPVIPAPKVLPEDEELPVKAIEPEPKPIDPVPVRVMETVRDTRQLVQLVCSQAEIQPNQAYRISRRDDRVSLRITNLDATKHVYLSELNTQGAVKNGYPVMASRESLPLKTTMEVYVWNPDLTTIVTVAILAEYVTEIE